jgi:hypothetical protein
MARNNTCSVDATGVVPRGAVHRGITGAALRLLRPFLKMNMVAYRAEVANSLFPAGTPEGEVVAPDSRRMLFVGDIAASGYGVLNHGLAVVAQTARSVAREWNSGCSWSTITDAELTMSRAAAQLTTVETDVDVVVIILGPPDVLLGTTAAEWSAKLRQLIATVRQGANPECAVVVAAIPPMYRFRAMPRFVQRILALQIHRLNRSSLQVVDSLPGVSYSPFPSLDTCTKFVHDNLNWRTVHALWGQQLGATISTAL